MVKFIVSYFTCELLLILGAVAFTLWYRKRRLKTKTESSLVGLVKTGEIFVDPTTGIKQQVWFNPRTGERHYETIK